MATPKPGFIKHFNNFISVSRKDKRLTGNHVSLYVALFSTWNQHYFQNPFEITREKVLQICHIGSFNTYSKCLKDLHDFGYIIYARAELKGRKSAISIVTALQDINDTRRSTDNEIPEREINTGSDTNMRPNTNNVNCVDNERGNAPPPNKKNDEEQGANARPDNFHDVVAFFHLLGHPDREAAKFFHHYEANGWRQAGKIPITNWSAAAQKWILNIHPTQTLKNGKRAKPGNLHSNQDKSYSDPL
jgi:hypothetical protein